MAADFRQFDEHGFPLPPRYSDLKYHDDEPARPKLSPRARRFLVLGIVLAVLALMFGPYLYGVGKDVVADWLATTAEHKYLQNDFENALRDLNWAVELNPKNLRCYQLRAAVRTEMNDLTGGLTDQTHFIDALESAKLRDAVRDTIYQKDFLTDAYEKRSWLYVRLHRSSEAMDDVNKAVDLTHRPQSLNARAYTRAVLKQNLKDALTDIESALKRSERENPEFLDTRGYLLYLLDRPEDALKDMNRAIGDFEPVVYRESQNDWPGFPREKLEFDRSLAVMFHHRGLVYEKLNQPEKAAEDIKRGDEFGYDPDRGVF